VKPLQRYRVPENDISGEWDQRFSESASRVHVFLNRYQNHGDTVGEDSEEVQPADGDTSRGSKGNLTPAGGLSGWLDWSRTRFAGPEGI
jgi:hypothetical protein